MGLIHFIEFIPKLWHIFFRDRLPTVKYSNPCLIAAVDDPHLDPFLIFYMMDGVGKIIPYHLLCLELIRPHKDRTVGNKINLRLRLTDKDIAACDHALHQSHNVKSFKFYFIITELQLIQSQQILHHLIHLSSFIHDHITVEFPAFRIVIHSFFQAFRIPLDQSQRSFQLMRYISQKFIAHIFYFFFLFNILFQLVIGAL